MVDPSADVALLRLRDRPLEPRPRLGVLPDFGKRATDGLAILDYAEELNRRKTVGDVNYKRVLDRWQAVGVVELTALIGYYTMVAMTLNCHDIPLPDGVSPPLPPAPE